MFTEREMQLLQEAVTDMAIYYSSTYFESEREGVLEKLQMIPTIKQEKDNV